MPNELTTLSDFVPLTKGKPWRFRFKIKDHPLQEEWSNWLINPSNTYFETERQGPYPWRDIEWIDIDPGESSPAAQTLLTASKIQYTMLGYIARIAIG